MAVKSIGQFLDRLKFSLNTELCTMCRSLIKHRQSEMICPACERRFFLRGPQPLMVLLAGSLYSACEFPYALKRILYGLKFQNKAQFGVSLSELLIHYWQQLPEAKKQGWIVVPIPPHGKNTHPAHLPLIARPFASHFGYDFVEDGLSWVKEVEPQQTILNKRKRRENVAGMLQVSPELMMRLQPDRKILVLDDILTTGSTLIEALSTIKRATPEITVSALTVANVPLAVTRQQKPR
jgi:predicted amidophosphoribosyltransferase